LLGSSTKTRSSMDQAQTYEDMVASSLTMSILTG
jgi:hypothetical protein